MLAVSEIMPTFAPHLEKCTTQQCLKAAIAQLVEHDLAKVGVASSSLVCRSFLVLFIFRETSKLNEFIH